MIKEVLQRVYRFLVTIDSEEQVETVPIEEYNKVKHALAVLEIYLSSLTEMKENKKDRNTLEEGFRYDMIRHLHEGIYFKSAEEKNKSIESFAKSKMTFEEITIHLNQVRSFRSENTTKLPQKSIPEKRTDTGYIK